MRRSNFRGRLGLALVLVVLCLGGRTAHAQASPVRYWISGSPFGFGGDLAVDQSWNTYGNFPGFGDSNTQGGGLYNFPSGWFVGSERASMGFGMSGLYPDPALGNFGSLYSEGVQFGYNFKDAAGSPVRFYAGFDSLKYNPGIGSPLGAFDSTSSTLPGYGAHAGVEFQATPNVSLSFGVGYTQQGSERLDSDINSSLPPGATPSAFSSGRR